MRRLCGTSEGDLDFNSWLEGDLGLLRRENHDVSTLLWKKVKVIPCHTHDLPDNVSGRVEVDETLVDLHLVPVPSLGTLTTWAVQQKRVSSRVSCVF